MEWVPLILLAALVLCCGPALANIDVPLRLEEPAGIARVAGPILSGVPLPRGLCRDPERLRLVDGDGAEVPAYFAAASYWWEDGSAKWVHVDLQRDLPAGGSETLRLRLADAPATREPGLSVEESTDSITVTTGPLRFRLRKHGFNLFDQVWLDESMRERFDDSHALIADRPRGARVKDADQIAWAALDANCEVQVEQVTPFRVVLRAEGRHLTDDGSPLTDFITRITAYAGKPYVTISHVFLVRQGETMASYLSVNDIGLVLPLDLTPGADGLVYRFGGDGQAHQGRLADKASAYLHQWSSEAYAIYRCTGDEWGTWRTSPRERGRARGGRVGWVDLSDGSRGAAVGVRDFWQLYPKTLEAAADGRITVGLYPDLRFENPLLLYPGLARTHEVTVLFHERASEAQISDLMTAAQSPLFLAAPPRWYCRDTLAFGHLSEADPEIYEKSYRDIVEGFERAFRESFEQIMTARDTREGLPPGVDEYGLINFGDGFHHFESGTLQWEDNYYDFPHALVLQFVRTGRRDYLDAARAYARHLGDVDISCYETTPEYLGGPRVCPAVDHVRSYHDGEPKTSPTFNFYKNQSLFEMWYLTGDRRFLEAALLSAGFVLTQDGMGFNQPRSVGHPLIAVRAAWEATGDDRYRARGRYYWQRIEEFFDEHEGGWPGGQFWQMGLAAEGMMDWYAITGDRQVLNRLRGMIDWSIGTWGDPEAGFKTGSFTSAAAIALCSEISGEPDYLERIVRYCRTRVPALNVRKVKNYGITFRGTPYFLWWLQQAPPPVVPED